MTTPIDIPEAPEGAQPSLEEIVVKALREAFTYAYDKGQQHDQVPDHLKAEVIKRDALAAINAYILAETLNIIGPHKPGQREVNQYIDRLRQALTGRFGATSGASAPLSDAHGFQQQVDKPSEVA